MNKLLLLAAGLACSVTAISQTTLFSDNFESGGGNWTLNGGSGSNQWMVNNEYLGYAGLINDTPDQPGGITNSPNSTYMHITNNTICGAFSVCNANFDTGSSSNQPSTITNVIDATGYNTVTLSFWYLCAGATNVSYGTVEYSTNGGSTWTSTGTNYVNTSSWTQESVSMPAWSNVSNLKFRFRWQNGGSGNDPAFSVDEVLVTGIGGSFATITTGSITASWCFNTASNITVPFNVSGTVNPGNIYTAQLSNSTGSFASPTTIGSLTSSATGSLSINGVIPGGTPSGTGYRIRVIASDPVTTGSDNGTDLVMHPQPVITVVGNPADGIICNTETITLLASGGVAYSWTPTATIDFPTQAQVIASPTATTTYSVLGTDVNGCTNTGTFTVTVEDCSGINENALELFALYPNPAVSDLTIVAKGTAQITAMELVNLNGQVIRQLPVSAVVDVNDLASGQYVVRITHDMGVSNMRFTKQ